MNIKRPRIALVHNRDARNVRSWSGTNYFSKLALQQHVGDVVDLSPAPMSLLPYKVSKHVLKKVVGKNYSYDHDISLAKRYGKFFSARIKEGDYDLIYSPSGSATLAYLETDVPIISYADATWDAMKDYYVHYSSTIRRTDIGGDTLERLHYKNSSIVLFSSRWAYDSAIHHYGVNPAKVHVVYIGANLPHPPKRSDVLQRELGKRIRLLLVGVSWETKGGDIAYQALLSLLERGYDAELTVVGCTPPNGIHHPRMHVVSFLNKQVPEEREQFERLWYDADFFILPTRYEAAGVVFCEASAHALPSIATRTGGVPSLVVDGANGYTLPPEAGGKEYADVVVELVSNPERYMELCRTSRDEYEQRLNWDSWGQTVAKIIAERFPHLRDRVGQEIIGEQ